ncbi:MAG: 3-methyl-2-oxobutanoate hydroxymethyltransferase [Betaproteobacteria bacterium]|nr:3-methyl-2-oxobutanoate hydroxymethyltransferase [Betaproteobacteria bacterium]
MNDLISLQQCARNGEKLAMLTCYDASFAARMEAAGIDAILVGDTLGMVVQGQTSTLPVSLDEMAYHTSAVARGARHTFLIADLPFGSYQGSPAQALQSAARLLAAGAHCVKLEGGAVMAETVAFLVARGIPVCGHLGLLPQSVHALGGYKVQAKNQDAAQQLHEDAQLLTQCGAGMLVLEAIPAPLAKEVTEHLPIPTIGIGAGAGCSGQVLVLYDMLGITLGKVPRFAHNFLRESADIEHALGAYIQAVKQGHFPTEAHSFMSAGI